MGAQSTLGIGLAIATFAGVFTYKTFIVVMPSQRLLVLAISGVFAVAGFLWPFMPPDPPKKNQGEDKKQEKP